MSEMTVEDFRAALARHASAHGEVFPSALGLIEAEGHPVGRVWDVARLVMSEQEQMRYLCGGNHPDEVAGAVESWAESKLSLDEIRTVIGAGGYDPDPFEALAAAGQLERALHDGGATRMIHGERAGCWISDELTLAADADIVGRVLQECAPTPPAPGS